MLISVFEGRTVAMPTLITTLLNRTTPDDHMRFSFDYGWVTLVYNALNENCYCKSVHCNVTSELRTCLLVELAVAHAGIYIQRQGEGHSNCLLEVRKTVSHCQIWSKTHYTDPHQTFPIKSGSDCSQHQPAPPVKTVVDACFYERVCIISCERSSFSSEQFACLSFVSLSSLTYDSSFTALRWYFPSLIAKCQRNSRRNHYKIFLKCASTFQNNHSKCTCGGKHAGACSLWS